MEQWRTTIIQLNSKIEVAIRSLDQTAMKICLVIDDTGIFQGTIADGDIRRGLLKGLTLESSVNLVLHKGALVVPPGISRDTVMQLMLANKIQQIPIIDSNNYPVGLHLFDEISGISEKPNLMVIMAGGMGTRLRPHTQNCPKPLLPVNGKPMLEHIIMRAKSQGFNHFLLSVHYLGGMIEEYFETGKKLGVTIDYLRENDPLGTAGALSLIKLNLDVPFLVSNGDVLSDISYAGLLDFHVRQNACATMAVRLYEWQSPFGVVQTNGLKITGFEEKPIIQNYINAGIYALSPEALPYLKDGEHCDMPTLFDRIRNDNKEALAYPMHEPWLDVGRPDDLVMANHDSSTI